MKNKYKVLFGISAVILSQFALAKPQEDVVLNTGAAVEAHKTFRISLKPLSTTINYTVKCTLNNPSENNALPISFYPEKGEIGETSVNGKKIGSGPEQSSTNINKGQSELVMTHVSRDKNNTLLLKNGAINKQDNLVLMSCIAQSEN